MSSYTEQVIGFLGQIFFPLLWLFPNQKSIMNWIEEIFGKNSDTKIFIHLRRRPRLHAEMHVGVRAGGLPMDECVEGN